MLENFCRLPLMFMGLLTTWFLSTSGVSAVKPLKGTDILRLASLEEPGLKQFFSNNPSTLSFEVSEEHLKVSLAYERLQIKLAHMIPVEFKRPEIIVQFVFEVSSPSASLLDIGVVGGIGPISDARIMRNVVERIATLKVEDRVKLSVLSSPPPRKLLDRLVHGPGYLYKLWHFLDEKSFYFIASNTAYVHRRALSLIVGSPPHTRLPQMVVASGIRARRKSIHRNEAVLVLDTKKAREKRLYQDILDSYMVPYVRLLDSEHQTLNHWIKRIKKSTLDETDEKALASFVMKIASRYQTRSILLGCTELSIALESELPEWEAEYFVFNSEEILIEEIITSIRHGGLRNG